MKALAIAWLAVMAAPFPVPASAQSTTAPQAAPSIPPGEAPPEAARDPEGTDDVAAPGRPGPDRPEPRRDPPTRDDK